MTAEVAALLGHDAQRVGFVPGAVVDLAIVQGVVMIALAEDITTVDVQPSRLPEPASAALTRG